MLKLYISFYIFYVFINLIFIYFYNTGIIIKTMEYNRIDQLYRNSKWIGIIKKNLIDAKKFKRNIHLLNPTELNKFLILHIRIFNTLLRKRYYSDNNYKKLQYMIIKTKLQSFVQNNIFLDNFFEDIINTLSTIINIYNDLLTVNNMSIL